MARYSPARWWSWQEVARQIMQQFGDVLPFVQHRLQAADNRTATLTQIEEMLTVPQCKASLYIELAAVVDAGTPMLQ